MGHLINEALVFIGAAIIFVPLFQRLGFGSVLGYLIAGMVVGPFGLKFIKDIESALHVSELGVVLLLFVIGLEMRPRKLWGMKTELLGLGGLQIFISALIFTGAGIYFGLNPVSSAVIGFGLSLSSTAYALQTLIDKNNLNTEFGRGSFSILLMQDLVAIPALAIIPAIGIKQETGENLNFLFPLFVIALILANMFVIRPFFRWMAGTHSREIFTATALFIVLGVSGIMLKIGLSAALGAFIAGMLLADSEYRHELEANLEPFKSLLLGLFFIAIGMTVNIGLILNKPILILSLAIGYLLIKFLVIFGVAKIFKKTNLNAKLMAITIAQGGEFAFVIFGMAISTKLVDPETVNILVAVVTVTMSINPILILIDEKLLMKRNHATVEPNYDKIKDEEPRVIIAGFGRFGQMFGRILRSQKIPFVAIDHDADQIELLRKFGNKVYYGDVLRMDILEAAGIKKAKYFVLAIDDVEISLKAAKLIRLHYPDVMIFARSRNRDHTFSFMDLGIDYVKRETFDSSVNFARELLLEMGVDKNKVNVLIEKFREHDHLMLLEQFKARGDDEQYMSATRRAGAQLTRVLEDESSQSYIK